MYIYIYIYICTINQAFIAAESQLKTMETEKDSLQSELESLKDFMVSEKSSHELEANRLKELLNSLQES